MKVFRSMTHEKLVVPRLSFKSVGKPNTPCPASSVPVMQAIASDMTVFLVTNDNTMASIAGMIDINPIVSIKNKIPLLFRSFFSDNQ